MKPSTVECSLITICSGRMTHLRNLLRGLQAGEVLSTEVVIVEPEPSRVAEEFTDLNIESVHLALSADGDFNVGAARNRGAAAASHDLLVFLDVDCIPSPTFLKVLTNHPARKTALLMGDPHYLFSPLGEGWEVDQLPSLSTPHPHRPGLAKGASDLSSNYGLFWSLCFQIHRATWDKLGGFDEGYGGYGAEDTDMAWEARLQNVPFYLVAAVAFHQQHGVSSPPVNHFSSILANCEMFYTKWKEWPMGNWLAAFQELELIKWRKDGEQIELLRQPDAAMLEKFQRPHAPFA